jgi:hypothetical protein
MYRSTPGTARHGRPARFPHLEAAGWLLSTAGRGWRWVWSAVHDDAVSAAVAGMLRFSILATLIFVVAATR